MKKEDATPSPLDGLSKDLEYEAREKLRSVFPDCFVEGKLDIDKLLNLCGEYMTDDFERYNFTWKGKSECYQLVQKRSSGTLRPCPAESVDFDTTQNLYIEGDNLEVLKLLQNSYHRQVKMIYIDPPYNTGHDFVYEDDFSEPLATYQEVISQTTKSNPETMGRFHTNWLNMMYPRLRLAANLLRDDGVICVSIDDNEVHRLRLLLDEAFGEENFIANIVWQKAYVANMTAKFISNTHDHILVYAKSHEMADVGKFQRTEEQIEKFQNPDNDPRGPWKAENLSAGKFYSAGQFEITGPNGSKYLPPPGRYWRCNQTRFDEWLKDGRIWFGKDGASRPMLKKYLGEMENGLTPDTWWDHKSSGSNKEATIALKELLSGEAAFDTPKPVKLVSRLLTLFAEKDSVVLDFFSGSGTTAQAVMQLNAEDGGNRRFIMVQLPELCNEKTEAFKAGYKNICEIGKERIRRAGQKIQEELANQAPKLDFEGESAKALDTGFKAFKLDTSNHKLWDPSPVSRENLSLLEQRLSGMTDRLKPDRSDLDMIYELMLKLGLPLTDEVKPLDIDGKRVWSVGPDCLIAVCLDKDIEVETIEKIAALAPARIIFGQDCFGDASAYSNAKLKLRDLGVEHKYV